MNNAQFDQEEKDILESYERGEWTSIDDTGVEKNMLGETAKNTLHLNKKVDIQLSQKDFDQIQIKAAQQGIPYETLLSSIIHRYVSGDLVENK